jgi:hypothetical protein
LLATLSGIEDTCIMAEEETTTQTGEETDEPETETTTEKPSETESGETAGTT